MLYAVAISHNKKYGTLSINDVTQIWRYYTILLSVGLIWQFWSKCHKNVDPLLHVTSFMNFPFRASSKYKSDSSFFLTKLTIFCSGPRLETRTRRQNPSPRSKHFTRGNFWARSSTWSKQFSIEITMSISKWRLCAQSSRTCHIPTLTSSCSTRPYL